MQGEINRFSSDFLAWFSLVVGDAGFSLVVKNFVISDVVVISLKLHRCLRVVNITCGFQRV